MANKKNSSTLKIAMLGASGVGKTSLLTVMYKELENTTAKTSLQLSTDEESQGILEQHYEKLKEFATTPGFDLTELPGIQGTEKPCDFYFDLSLEKKGILGEKVSLKLEFWDYPGGYTTQKEKRSEVQDHLKKCGAVVIAVNTMALMENEGKFHEKINQTQDITKLFYDAYKEVKEPRLVIFAPVKCETYIVKKAEEIAQKIEKEYAPLLEFFNPMADKVAVAIAPVVTVGCVECGGSLELDDGTAKFYLNKTSNEYNPKYADQPIRYLLRFLIKRYFKAEQGGFWWNVTQWLHQHKNIREAMEKFAKGSKSTGAFKILQGSHLLKLD